MTKVQKFNSKRTKPQTIGGNVYFLAVGKYVKYHTSIYTELQRTPSLCPTGRNKGHLPKARSSLVRSHLEEGFTKHLDQSTNVYMCLRVIYLVLARRRLFQ